MDQSEIKKRILSRIRKLEKELGKDDGDASDRDWDILQERISAKIDAYVDVLAIMG